MTVACPDKLKLIKHPNHGDMLRAWVNYEASRFLKQKKCQSSILFSLKMAFAYFSIFFCFEYASNQLNIHRLHLFQTKHCFST